MFFSIEHTHRHRCTLDRSVECNSPLSVSVQDELFLAQEQASERIQKVLFKAEAEVADKVRFMNTEQRLDKANSELIQAEEHLLAALSSLYKALCYTVPHVSRALSGQAIKEIQGVIRLDVEQSKTSK